jgi:hypothetical protein
MALVKADRVKETSTSTGTGNFTLAGAVPGYRTFASVDATNQYHVFFYSIIHSNGIEWETGYGRLIDSTTMERKYVHSSSNVSPTSLVNFSAGTKEVFISITERQALSGQLPNSGTTGIGINTVNMNLFMGYQTAYLATLNASDSRNILIGNRVANNVNINNTSPGLFYQNIAIGNQACLVAGGAANSSGNSFFNTTVSIGDGSSSSTLCASACVIIGSGAGTSAANATQIRCVVIGANAKTSFDDEDSTVVGCSSASIDGKRNTIFGARSVSQTTHQDCIVIGYDVDSVASNTITIGSFQTDCYIAGHLHPSGAVRPASIADASAPTNAIYYSTTAGKLVYKDASGTVNNLY